MDQVIAGLKRSLPILAAVAAIAMSVGPTFAQDSKSAVPPAKDDWRETYAYTLGMQAYVFGFPWILYSQTRWQWVTQPRDPKHMPYAALNQFWHAQQLVDAAFRDGGTPNNDTMYSVAWLDLSKEPLILSVPEMGDRYYSMEMASFESDYFAYVGTRTTGTGAGHYAILGPDWKGSLPDGVTPLPRSRTPYALMLGRTLVYGPEDVENVRKIQAQYTLTPLSVWGKQNAPALAPSRAAWPPFDPKGDPLAQWKTMNRAMTENPPYPGHLAIVRNFASIGIGPNQDVETMDVATKRGLARAARDGMKMVRDAMESGLGKRVNGWDYPPAGYGQAGMQDDFLLRAGPQCLGGIIANDPEEAIYLNTVTDMQGERLSGANRYTMRFAPGKLPAVKAFWSLTMYSMDNNLVANQINRYKLGSYPKGQLKLDADGGLTLYVQNESPGKDKESNWLPAPKEEFYLVLRTYMPAPELVKQEWAAPSVTKTNL